MTEYQVVAKKCPACGETATGAAPAGVTSLVQYGPEPHALLRQARVLYADETPARGWRCPASWAIRSAAGLSSSTQMSSPVPPGPWIHPHTDGASRS